MAYLFVKPRISRARVSDDGFGTPYAWAGFGARNVTAPVQGRLSAQYAAIPTTQYNPSTGTWQAGDPFRFQARSEAAAPKYQPPAKVVYTPPASKSVYTPPARSSNPLVSYAKDVVAKAGSWVSDVSQGLLLQAAGAASPVSGPTLSQQIGNLASSVSHIPSRIASSFDSLSNKQIQNIGNVGQVGLSTVSIAKDSIAGARVLESGLATQRAMTGATAAARAASAAVTAGKLISGLARSTVATIGAEEATGGVASLLGTWFAGGSAKDMDISLRQNAPITAKVADFIASGVSRGVDLVTGTNKAPTVFGARERMNWTSLPYDGPEIIPTIRVSSPPQPSTVIRAPADAGRQAATQKSFLPVIPPSASITSQFVSDRPLTISQVVSQTPRQTEVAFQKSVSGKTGGDPNAMVWTADTGWTSAELVSQYPQWAGRNLAPSPRAIPLSNVESQIISAGGGPTKLEKLASTVSKYATYVTPAGSPASMLSVGRSAGGVGAKQPSFTSRLITSATKSAVGMFIPPTQAAGVVGTIADYLQRSEMRSRGVETEYIPGSVGVQTIEDIIPAIGRFMGMPIGKPDSPDVMATKFRAQGFDESYIKFMMGSDYGRVTRKPISGLTRDLGDVSIFNIR